MKIISIIPKPQKIIKNPGYFPLTKITNIVVDSELKKIGDYLKQLLLHATGTNLPIFSNTQYNEENNVISLNLNKALDKLGPEGYILKISPENITILSSMPKKNKIMNIGNIIYVPSS